MNQLEALLEQGGIAPVDREFARFLERHYAASPEMQLAGGLASAELRAGNTWIDLDSLAGCTGIGDEASAVLGRPGQRCPLILDGRRLSLHRAWSAERRIAAILARQFRAVPACGTQPAPAVLELARELFREKADSTGAFADLAAAGGHLQAAAAFLPFQTSLTVISGGPGTGKTTTLARLLALQVAQAEAAGRDLPRILLCAPTGKAAARMAESLARECAGLPPGLAAALRSQEARTIHRLLGLGGVPGAPRFNADHAFEADIVVVDECSMVDLGLMLMLLEALPENAALVLVGDRNQLPSIEAGRVLADVCAAFPANGFSPGFAALVNSVLARPESRIAGRAERNSPVIELRHSWRFAGGGAIGAVSRLVNDGAAAEALRLVAAPADGPAVCTREDLPGPDGLLAAVQRGWKPFLAARSPAEALDLLDGFMCLTITNQGRQGRSAINRAMLACLGEPRVRPLLITENSVRHGLFNGYLGVLFRENGQTRAWFRDNAGVRPFLPAFLPPHEDAFAITVHKSQGSEFRELLLILPDLAADSPARPGRELLYTGITRAKSACRIFASEAAFRDAVEQVTTRRSGLAGQLAACLAE